MAPKKDTCYVVMPYYQTSEDHTEEYWDNHFHKFLKPLIEENDGLEARRSLALSGELSEETLSEVMTSRLVVADLTDLSPSVFWELGSRQTFSYATITVAEEGTKVPLNICSRATLFYSNEYFTMAKFLREFNRALALSLEQSAKSGDEVLEEVTRRETLLELFTRYETIRRVENLLSECEQNRRVVDQTVSQMRANEAGPDRFLHVTEPLRIPAIELLITKRYVDSDYTFYQLTEDCFAGLQKYQEAINSWSSDPGQFGPWLITNGEHLTELLASFGETLEYILSEKRESF